MSKNKISKIDLSGIEHEHFSSDALEWMCEAEPEELVHRLGMERVTVPQSEPDDFYLFKDNGSRVLAVAHLDTVQADRTAVCVETSAGWVVHSGALDDRLGAYVLACLLPSISEEYRYDLLFTTGEESGQSTAAYFHPSNHHDREYDWIIEFDRGGTDVVLYQYEDDDLIDRVQATGARVENGAFSDISFLGHLGIKAMNWGVGYQNYHSIRGHAYLDDTFKMVNHFLNFHAANYGTRLLHEKAADPDWWEGSRVQWLGASSGRTVLGQVYDDESECVEEGWGTPCEGEVSSTEVGALCEKHINEYMD